MTHRRGLWGWDVERFEDGGEMVRIQTDSVSGDQKLKEACGVDEAASTM